MQGDDLEFKKGKTIGTVHACRVEGGSGFLCSYDRESTPYMSEELIAYAARSFIETLSIASSSAQQKNGEQFQAKLLEIINRSFAEESLDFKSGNF